MLVHAAFSVVLMLASAAPLPVQTFSIPAVGTVHVHRAVAHPERVVLYVSGDGGWNRDAVDMAQALTGPDTLVIGVDIRSWRKKLESGGGRCSYPAADLEQVSQVVQKKLGYPRYVSPVLVGYSSGATLVYGVLAQAPPATFRGAISLGFCPDLELSKPLCPGSGLHGTPQSHGRVQVLAPAAHLQVPWVVLNGDHDKSCPAAQAQAFAARVNRGSMVVLPQVGHDFRVPARWLPQFRSQLDALLTPAAPARVAPPLPAGSASVPSVDGLPLVEVPAEMDSPGDTMAVVLSGDGGWASIDRELAHALAQRGIPVVGLDSLQYFWDPKTPEQGATDLERIVRHYSARYGKKRILLVGYSRGADVLPAFACRMPAAVLDQVRLLVFLAVSPSTSFEFHVMDLVGGSSETEVPVEPDLMKLRGRPMLCVYGEEERAESLCPRLGKGVAHVVEEQGGHHLGGNYEKLVTLILSTVP